MSQIRTFSVKIRTRLSYDGLDNICGQYCRAPYSIHLGSLDTTSKVPRKIMIVACTDAQDRDRIKAVFTMRGAHAAKTAEPSNDPGPPPDRAA